MYGTLHAVVFLAPIQPAEACGESLKSFQASTTSFFDELPVTSHPHVSGRAIISPVRYCMYLWHPHPVESLTHKAAQYTFGHDAEAVLVQPTHQCVVCLQKGNKGREAGHGQSWPDMAGDWLTYSVPWCQHLPT